jgi:hypothetical protein
MMTTRIKVLTYSELRRYDTLEDRFRYLQLRGRAGEATFGFDRWINQRFYKSAEWKRTRNLVITRDNGCDLGIPGFEIYSRILIHHMNPLLLDDIREGSPDIMNPEFLITTTHNTHNAIHYGDERLLPRPLAARTPGDTKPW